MAVTSLFGIAEGTTRVALSRLAADGDVQPGPGGYHLSERLAARQRVQDAALRPALRPFWSGEWEIAVAAAGAGVGKRGDLAATLSRLRLAELRPGVWVRPDNLKRPWPAQLEESVRRWRGRPDSPVAVTDLWDLEGWARRAGELMARMDATADPPERFVTAAAMVRHLRDDPVLPVELLPPAWPGSDLRRVYDSYRQELRRLVEGV